MTAAGTKPKVKKNVPATTLLFPAEKQEVVVVHLENIQVDTRQPRENDAAKTANVDNIASTLTVDAHGVARPIHPIQIRKTPPWAERQDVPWMIFDGECRYSAATVRGAVAVTTIEIALPEEKVFEAQVLTAMAREGLGPAAQLEAVRRFDEQHPNENAMNAAARLGMKTDVVRSLRKIVGLPAEVRGNFMAGNHTLEVCDTISRIEGATPEEKVSRQESASRATLKMDPKKAREYILKTFLLRLKDAPFDREDATLNQETGVCSACPHRTGAQASLFGSTDATDDCCTKKSCWDQKVAATVERNPPPEEKTEEPNGKRAKEKALGKTTQQDVLIAAALAAGCDASELDAKFSTTRPEEIDLSLQRLTAHGNPNAGPALLDRQAKGKDLGGYSRGSAHALAAEALDKIRDCMARLAPPDVALFLRGVLETTCGYLTFVDPSVPDPEDAPCEPTGEPPPPPPARRESSDVDPEGADFVEEDPSEEVFP